MRSSQLYVSLIWKRSLKKIDFNGIWPDPWPLLWRTTFRLAIGAVPCAFFFFFFWPVGFSHHPHHLSFKKLVIKKRTASIDCNRRNALSKTKSYKTIFQSSKFLFTANLFYFDYVMAHLYSTLPSPIQDIPKKYFTYSAEWL